FSRLRTRKFPATKSPGPTFGGGTLVSLRVPLPPANRMTDAAGCSGLINMKACWAPREVEMDTIEALPPRASSQGAANRIPSRKVRRNTRSMLALHLAMSEHPRQLRAVRVPFEIPQRASGYGPAHRSLAQDI